MDISGLTYCSKILLIAFFCETRIGGEKVSRARSRNSSLGTTSPKILFEGKESNQRVKVLSTYDAMLSTIRESFRMLIQPALGVDTMVGNPRIT